MNKIAILGGAALALAVPQASAMAQETKKVDLTQEQKDHGVQTFQLLASAMQSQNVPDEVKSVLMGCMYENPIGKISETVDSVIAANPGKIDRSKPDQMLGVIAHICGYEPPAGGTPPGKAPTSPSGAAKGR